MQAEGAVFVAMRSNGDRLRGGEGRGDTGLQRRLSRIKIAMNTESQRFGMSRETVSAAVRGGNGRATRCVSRNR